MHSPRSKVSKGKKISANADRCIRLPKGYARLLESPERTDYKVIGVRMKDGKPIGEYEDFLTGFAVYNNSVWGRCQGRGRLY